jgi:hypothetical protein
MTTCAEWATKLAEAEAALHALQIGGKVVSVQMGEKRIEYSKAGVNALAEYVQYLQAKVDACNGVPRLARRVFGVIPLG